MIYNKKTGSVEILPVQKTSKVADFIVSCPPVLFRRKHEAALYH